MQQVDVCAKNKRLRNFKEPCANWGSLSSFFLYSATMPATNIFYWTLWIAEGKIRWRGKFSSIYAISSLLFAISFYAFEISSLLFMIYFKVFAIPSLLFTISFKDFEISSLHLLLPPRYPEFATQDLLNCKAKEIIL